MSRGGSLPSRKTQGKSAAPRPTHRRSPTSCSPGAASARPNGSRHPWPLPAHPLEDNLELRLLLFYFTQQFLECKRKLGGR